MSSLLFPDPNDGPSGKIAHWNLMGFFLFCFLGWVDLAVYFFTALFIVIPWFMLTGGK